MDILIKLYSFRAPLWLPLLTTWESVFMFGALKIKLGGVLHRAPPNKEL